VLGARRGILGALRRPWSAWRRSAMAASAHRPGGPPAFAWPAAAATA